MRCLLAVVGMLCSLALAGPVYAQNDDPLPPELQQELDQTPDPTAVPAETPDATETPDPDATPDDTTEPVPTPIGCGRGPGTDADYDYCPDPCGPDAIDYGADGDYAYCALPAGTGNPPHRVEESSEGAPSGAIQGLPLTGANPALLALFGLAFLLTGAGLRLRSASRAR